MLEGVAPRCLSPLLPSRVHSRRRRYCHTPVGSPENRILKTALGTSGELRASKTLAWQDD